MFFLMANFKTGESIMKRRLLISLLMVVCAVCLVCGLSACDLFGLSGGSDSTSDSKEVETVEKISSDGEVSVYSITFTDGTSYTFTVIDDDNQSSEGKSAYEIYLMYYPEYVGNEEQWIYELINGSLVNVGTSGLIYTISSDGTYYYISGYTGTSAYVTIPSTYEGLPVSAIGSYAFYNNTTIISVTISDRITIIGSGAFSGCVNLVSVNIGSNVKVIDERAFSGCEKLTEISIPANVVTIGDYAFSGCVKIVVVAILGNPEFGEGVFSGCVLISDITLSEDLIAQIYDIIDAIFYDSPNLSVIRDTTYAIYHIHELTYYERVEGYCGTSGNIEYWYCSVCDKYYSDSHGSNEISEEDVFISTGAHNFVDNVCTVCGTVGLILNGRVYKADGDADTTNNTLLIGITITLTSSTGIIYTAVTDSSGSYVIDSLVEGDYVLTVSEVGYIELVQNLTISLNITQNINLMVVEGDETQTGGVSGYAQDSTTGNVISGITVYARSGVNNSSGEVVVTASTNSNGLYSLSNLAVGNYTLQFVDERELEDEDYRYTTGTINVAVIGDTIIANQNIVLNNNATITATSMRIVLTWGSSPSDLDSHLTTSNGDHIWYSNKTYEWGNLDVDDTSSYGPETITISTIEEGVTYTYYVYNFSGGGNSVLSNSGASVTVYIGDTESYTFTVPSGSGRYWTLFTYNTETGFTVINTISTSINS